MLCFYLGTTPANIQDKQGNTPLHISTLEGLCDISQLLVDSGCKIDGENNRGETPLHSALRGKNIADAKLLLRNNADANIQDNQGNTLLHISTRDGLCDISQLLVDSGCKINGGTTRAKRLFILLFVAKMYLMLKFYLGTTPM